MAYNTKPIITDVDGNPISQYYNSKTDNYEPIEGSGGGNKVVLYNADGTENNSLSLIPILDKLSQLTGTVIDEETRKSNELQRIAFFNTLQQMLADGELKGEQGIQGIQGETGKGLEFNWRGTELGVKIEGDSDYIYVNLKGETGSIDNLNSQHITNALGYTPADKLAVDDLAGVGRTTETVKKNADNLDAHKADFTKLGFKKPYTVSYGQLYIDEINGNDINDGLTQSTAIKTISRLWQLTPQRVQGNFTINVVGHLSDNLFITDYLGSTNVAVARVLKIKGVTGVASNHRIYGIRILNCLGNIELEDIEIGANLLSCEINGRTQLIRCLANVNTASAAINASAGAVEVRNCNINNAHPSGSSLSANTGATLLSIDNTGTAAYGLYALHGGVIAKGGSSQPIGTVANERIAVGGVIR